MFRVVRMFADLKDNGHIYQVGDTYPRSGVEVDTTRLEELSSNRNKRGVVFIVNEEAEEGLSEVRGDIEETETKVDPPEAERTKKKPRRGQRKDA